MSNFNYNNYIGEHMGTNNYLKVKCKEDGKLYELVSIDMLENESIGLYDDFMQDTDWYSKDDFKTLIKSPSDLTNEEWLFVFGYNEDTIITTFKTNAYLEFFIKGYNFGKYYFDGGKFNFKNRILDHQQILNRLYSLHVSIDYAELIKNNKAVRKE